MLSVYGLMLQALISLSVRAYPARTTFAPLTRRFCFDNKLGQLPTIKPSTNSLSAFSDIDVSTQEQDDYLFGTKNTFSSLGVIPCIDKALIKLGRPTATAIQSATFSDLVTGQDVVIAAETGSGKTLSFLVPIFQMLLEDEFRESVHYPSAVIMVPNKELCFQVHRMASQLLDAIDENDRNITCATATVATGSWPYRMEKCPNILICTPAFIGKFIRGPNILDESLFRSIRHFVLDEADMLLEGSYLTDVEKILDAFKLIRRQMIRDGEIQVHSTVLQNILSAATLPSSGMRSMEKYIESRFPRAKWISNTHLHKHHPRIIQNYHEIPGSVFLTKERLAVVIRSAFNQPVTDDVDSSISFLKTIPRDGDALLQAPEPTMIFVNTAEVAVELATALRKLGIDCAEFHKNQISSEKQQGLQRFRDDEVKILVCTDHAARGLDLPHVKHVIQAEFALNVVQHLHRIGRSSRAGVLGKATNIVDDRSIELVDSILSDEDNKKVDQSFSRRRGFRNKIKKAIRRSRRGEDVLDETSNDDLVE